MSFFHFLVGSRLKKNGCIRLIDLESVFLNDFAPAPRSLGLYIWTRIKVTLSCFFEIPTENTPFTGLKVISTKCSHAFGFPRYSGIFFQSCRPGVMDSAMGHARIRRK